MEPDEVIEVFRECGAYLEGHFILSSGLRSRVFLQKARVFMHPQKTERLCHALSDKIRAAGLDTVDFVVGPAIGGLIPAYETARQLGVRNLWVERQDGEFRLRRFSVEPGARVIIVEDIVSTGLSIREAVTAMRKAGAQVLAAACIVDRSAGKADVGVPLIALAEHEVPAYPADNLPPELASIPPLEPGSRNL